MVVRVATLHNIRQRTRRRQRFGEKFALQRIKMSWIDIAVGRQDSPGVWGKQFTDALYRLSFVIPFPVLSSMRPTSIELVRAD